MSVDEDETSKPVDRTRRALVDAGWKLLDGITVGEALESLTAQEIAREAGRSERTFWNHFGDWDRYTSELLADIPRRGPMEPDDDSDAVGVVDHALAGSNRSGLPDLARLAALANWTEVMQPGELLALRRQLFLLSRTGAEPGIAHTVGSDYYGRYIPMLQAIYEKTGVEAAVAPLPPLGWEQFTRTLAALSEGFSMQAVADPKAVTAEFVTEATAAVALSLLSPLETPETAAERSVAFAGPGSEVRDDPDLVEMARSCRPLIEANGGLVSWTSVADLVGVTPLEIRNRAQRLSVLEALAFSESEPFALEDGAHEGDPPRRALEGICRLVRAARADAVCGASLLAERLRPGRDREVVRSLVPLGAGLAETLGESPRSCHDRIANVALCAALSDTASSPADVAELAWASHPTRGSGSDA